MTGAIAPLGDLSGWARGNFLVIVLLVLGAILLTRFAVWARDRFMARLDARHIEADELVRSEAAKHRQVVAQVLTWMALAVIYIVTAVLIVQHLGVPLAGLVAPAALISAGARVRAAAVRPGHRGRAVHHRGTPVRFRRCRPDLHLRLLAAGHRDGRGRDPAGHPAAVGQR